VRRGGVGEVGAGTAAGAAPAREAWAAAAGDHLGLVESVAASFGVRKGNPDRDDLVQAGLLALRRVVSKHEGGRAGFGTYARRALIREMSKTLARLRRREFFVPTTTMRSHRLDPSRSGGELVRRALAYRPADPEDHPLGGILAEPDRRIADFERADSVEAALARLRPLRRAYLRARFGMDGGGFIDPGEAADAIGLPRLWGPPMEARALADAKIGLSEDEED
jgi:RNA polymerase sigma factor (sigma-70 family)